MDKLISVIVPVYNVEKYLKKCIDSIINQTYRNLEIILVDDGSPDNAGKICDEYALKDHRIRVIHKENGGLSDARNAGIDVANGEFIMFVDGDDYIADIAIEQFYQSILNDRVDIAIACMDSVDEYGNRVKMFSTAEKKICSGIDAFFEICTGKSAFGAPNRLYKTNQIREYYFKVGVLHEDVFFTTDLFTSKKVKNVSFLPFVGYFYFQRSDSIMGDVRNRSPKTDLIKAHEYIIEKAHEFVNDEANRFEIEKKSIDYLSSFSLIPDYKTSKEYDLCLRKFIINNRETINRIGYSRKHQMGIKLFCCSPSLYRLLKQFLRIRTRFRK